jgi:hypothetical protein
VDLLLHLLSNIVHLPVTKEVVKESGMGKAIGSVEKHPICAGSQNEGAIRDRLRDVKNAWNASVKASKAKETPNEAFQDRKPNAPSIEPILAKRLSNETTVLIAKRTKGNDGTPIRYSLSSYISKASSKVAPTLSSPSKLGVGAVSPPSTYFHL